MSGDCKEQPNIFYTKGAPLLQAECLLNEGKVKSLYKMANEPDHVYIHFHDKVTAGNGRRVDFPEDKGCLLYTSPSPRDLSTSRMPSSA